MKIRTLLIILFFSHISFAQPGTVTEHLKIDQFGYPMYAEKICVINNPQSGFDFQAGDFYTPGATLQVRNAINNELVFSGSASSWHSGATYDQSGDKLWWFNFSSITTPGSYYIYDPANNKHSFYFDIRDDVYQDALTHSVRMFFYQRSGFAKTSSFADDWTDGASHLGSLQDLDCRLATNPIASTSKQLQGGWFDAGDYNKYVNFAYEPIHDLLFAYIERPEIWTDDYNIPESGNGVPDLLDEVKWEMDWLRRMQLSDGSVLMKVSVPDWSAASPPSADTAPRRYGPAQASSTRSAASMFAIGALAYNLSGIPEMQAYADSLEADAIAAWEWLEDHPGYSYYDNAGFFSANPEMSEYQQYAVQVGSAVLLYALTGDAAYKTYVESNYDDMHPLQWTYWYAWESIIQDLLLFYSSLDGVSVSVKNAIQTSFLNSMANNGHLLPSYTNTSCGYRGYLNNNDNVWGSNRPRGHTGSMFYNYIHYDLASDTLPYRNAALGYINFLHGVNPISTVMLTNMNAFGAEKSANEMYHSWFADGTQYDNALTSPLGPAPGYQPGGFNPHYAPDPAYGGTISPPQNQPSLKSYKDWNTSWPEDSWEVTETSISNQGSYVKLLSKFIEIPCVQTITSFINQGQNTLRQAIECSSSGDTIRIDLPAGDTIHLTSPLIINKNLTLVNLNSGKVPMFMDLNATGIVIQNGITVHFHNLYLHGNGSSLIENNGILHLHDVTLDPDGLSAQPLNNHGQVEMHGLVNIGNP